MASDRRPVVRGTEAAWQRLGTLLQLRRAELGYRRRPAFTRERGINIRLVTDIENAYRPNTFLTPTLREIAQAYAVTWDSLIAVLAGTADELTAAPPAALPAAEDGGWPVSDPVRVAVDYPYFVAIERRLRLLAARGITDPDGTQVFLRAGGDPRDYAGIGSPADAKTWDGIGSRLDLDDRARLIADLQRRDGGRQSGGAGANAGLRGGNSAVYRMHVHRFAQLLARSRPIT